MCNYSFFMGADISIAVRDVAYHCNGQPIYLGQFDNCIDGFKAMDKQLSHITDKPRNQWFLCFENTGIYSKPLLEWLVSMQIPCKEESALGISKSLGLRRGKDDKIDAIDICQFAFEKRDSLEPSELPKPLIIKLRKLLARRDFLVRQRQSLSISIKEQKGFINDDLYDELSQGNDILIETYKIQIKNIETAIQQVIDGDTELCKNNQLARSVVGIGTVTSAYMIAVTENYKNFENGRKFACYCGVAPFPHRSGIRKGSVKISHIANKKMKSLFSNCILAAIKHDPELALYYNRKIKEGKRPGIVKNAVKNKLIHRVFAVINRQTPYVKIMNYA